MTISAGDFEKIITHIGDARTLVLVPKTHGGYRIAHRRKDACKIARETVQTLNFIEGTFKMRGTAPSMDEIALTLGVSKSVVSNRIGRLIDAGHLVGTTKHYTLPAIWAVCQQLYERDRDGNT